MGDLRDPVSDRGDLAAAHDGTCAQQGGLRTVDRVAVPDVVLAPGIQTRVG